MYDDPRTALKKTLGVTAAAILIFSFLVLSLVYANKTDETTPADGFNISSYLVELNVKENNEVEVTEKPTINFTNAMKHGIYKFVPYWLEYTPKTGKTVKRRSNIINLRAIGDRYENDKINGKARIKIGDPTSYVGEGPKEYTIQYTYSMGKDPYKGFDEFIFHAYGDFWGTPISNPALIINMPKSIEGYKVRFFSDKKRQNEITNSIMYQVKDNLLVAATDQSLTSSLTVDIELPEGYFVGGANNYGNKALVMCLLVIGLTIILVLNWILYGKDFKKEIETVELYPPDNLSAAELGYIFSSSQITKKMTIATIIELAAKGYIQIDEYNGKITIKDLTKKPKEDKTYSLSLTVKELKEVDDTLTEKEKEIMENLKPNKQGKSSILGDKAMELMDEIKQLVSKGYLEVVQNDFENLPLEYKSKEEEFQREVEEYNERIKNLPPMNEYDKIVFDRLFYKSSQTTLSENPEFYKAFKDIEDKIHTDLTPNIYDQRSIAALKLSAIITSLIIPIALTAFYITADIEPAYYYFYYLALLCIPICLVFTFIMSRRTQNGELINAKIKGFRNFLVTTEKSNLEHILEKDPRYFYNILPYTYVLNISNKWVEKFEDIPLPDMKGSFDLCDTNYVRIYDNVSFPTSATSAGGFGSSSCGGGCSSCGGGCSSCGGGGSW